MLETHARRQSCATALSLGESEAPVRGHAGGVRWNRVGGLCVGLLRVPIHGSGVGGARGDDGIDDLRHTREPQPYTLNSSPGDGIALGTQAGCWVMGTLGIVGNGKI
jgi:hypothetical protein